MFEVLLDYDIGFPRAQQMGDGARADLRLDLRSLRRDKAAFVPLGASKLKVLLTLPHRVRTFDWHTRWGKVRIHVPP